VSHAGRKHDGAALLGMAVPLGHDVADEIITVDARGELGLDVVSLLDADATQIEALGGRVDDGRDEMTGGGELGDLGTLDDDVEDATETRARRLCMVLRSDR
jgi:hypothetical protein